MESVATVDDVLLLFFIAWLLGVGVGVMIGGEVERRRRK